MRALGYQVIDMLVDHFERLPEQPVPGIANREALAQTLWEPVPEQGMAPDTVLAQLRSEVFEHISHVDHPRFFAFIPSPGNFLSVLADALVSGFNVFAGTWIESWTSSG
jgi:glutamate/tyrosine decarboxylase-like PLP-dependent enzyme